MSFNLHLQGFEAGAPVGLPRAHVRALFPVGADSEPDCWRVRYDDLNWCDLIVVPDPSDRTLIRSLCVHRPCRDGRLWDALLEVMRLGQVALYTPGDTPPLVADDSVAPHLPPALVEAFGPPRRVDSGHEIRRAIENA
jgi:hypothetical protein